MKNRWIITAALCMAMIISASPAFAQEEGAAETPGTEPERVQEIDLPEPDELLMEYMDQTVQLELKAQSDSVKTPRGDRLIGNDRKVYDRVRTAFLQAAAGKRSTGVVRVPMTALMGSKTSFTAQELGVSSLVSGRSIAPAAARAFYQKWQFDPQALLDAIIADLPYEAYWFDKDIGFEGEPPEFSVTGSTAATRRIGFDEGSSAAWTLYFYVSADYSTTGKPGSCTLDISKTKAATAAAANAADIIRLHEDQSDLQKLLAYKNEICTLTDYDTFAADHDIPYGDPWQMISVFDGNPATKVVCEGYSKAFEFLCDQSTFDSGIRVYTVGGPLDGGPHSFNIVRMDDGRNYLADLTNCDDDGYGQSPDPKLPDPVFLAGWTYDETKHAYVPSIQPPWDEYVDSEELPGYDYDQETGRLFEEDELKLSETAYPIDTADVCTCKDTPKTAITRDGAAMYIRNGWRGGTKCAVCGRMISPQSILARLPQAKLSAGQVGLSRTSFTYSGAVQKPAVTVKADGKVLPASAYTVTCGNNRSAGTYTVRVNMKPINQKYVGTVTKSYTIAKASQPLTVTAAKKTVKAKKLKKKKQTVRPLTVKAAQGTVTYKLIGGKARAKKALKVDPKTGRITVKKKTKKGTYTIRVKVSAAGNRNFAPGQKTVTVKVQVK